MRKYRRLAATALLVLVTIASLLLVAPAVFSAEDDLPQRVPVVEQYHSLGHACPVAWGLVTAWHVAGNEGDAHLGFVVGGRELEASTALRHRTLDAALWPMPDGMEALPAARVPAKAGDRVRIVGFEQNFRPRVVRTEVDYVIGAQFVTRDGAGYGSSGSCVVNDAGEVVGINIGGKDKQGGAGTLGISVAIDRFAPEQFRQPEPEPAEEPEPAGIPDGVTLLVGRFTLPR